MVASIMLRGVRSSSASVLRAASSHTGAASATRIALLTLSRLSTLRHASSQAATEEAVDQDTTSHQSSSQAKPLSMTTTPQGSVAVGSEFPTFVSLEGRVSQETLKAITGKPLGNLKHMSAVQAQVLPRLPELARPYEKDATGPQPPRDLLVKAKTGTGKTLGFLVPAVEARIKAIAEARRQALATAGVEQDKQLELRAERMFTRTEVGTLIISPTRELATQIANEAIKLTHFHEGFEVRLLVGGMSKGQQIRDWMKGRRDIVVATPGRLRDMIDSVPEVAQALLKTRQLVLDEADTLLDMGFRDDIEAISSALPPSPERQTLLFSATVSRAVEQIARATLAKNYEYINCVSADDSPVHAHVTQYHTIVPSADQQIPHLLRLLTHDQLTNPAKSKVIVFFPTTRMVQLFATLLRELAPTALPGGRRTSIYEIHSKRTQEARTNTSDRFRGDKSGASILVTSDVSARGVDYPGVSRVIQVGIPQSTDQYIHRVGRTGRGGAIGGRGDIVLLPWEMGFVTWQLNHVPLKPLTTESLKEQVATLTEKFDNDPKAFFKDTPATEQVAVDRRGRQDYSVPQIYQAPFAPKLQEQETSIRNLLTQADDEAIKETMASMLGYYLTKGPEMRVQKPIIVEGLKQWTVEACGLPTPPYISQAFLQRLGVSDNRTKHFGSAPRPPRERRSDAAPWSGRGAVSHRMLPQSTESGSKSWDLEEGDPRTPPEEYRTPRYGKTFTRKPGGSSGGYGDRNSGGGGGGYNRGGGDRGGERPAWGNSRGGGGGGSGGGRIRDSDW